MDFPKAIHNLIFYKQFAKVDKPRDFISFEQSKSIGIIYNATHPQNIEIIKSFAGKLKAAGKKVESLGYINLKKAEEIQAEYKDLDFIIKKEVTWYHKPKTFNSSRFIKNKYDILLNLYIEECLPLQYMSAFSDAKFRVGHFQKNNLYCNDFHIDLKGDEKVSSLIEQIEHYLNKNQ